MLRNSTLADSGTHLFAALAVHPRALYARRSKGTHELGDARQSSELALPMNVVYTCALGTHLPLRCADPRQAR